jgi:hypothetical protein
VLNSYKIFTTDKALARTEGSDTVCFLTTLEQHHTEDGPLYTVRVPTALVEELKLSPGQTVYLEVVAKE